MDLSVVIVNYNVQYFLEQCLKSVFKSGEGLKMEVFVVDNNSVDGSVEMVRKKFPKVNLIANRENQGFSKANNQAIKASKGRYVLLLNPDTVVEDDTLPKVVSFMNEHPDAGGLGVKMLDGQGRFLPESKRGLPTPSVAFYKIFGLSKLFPRSRIFGKYHLGYLDNEQVHQVEVLSGAFMLLRREALEKTGYLDEDFFMYGEDIDLSYRITRAGYKNYYYPGTRIIHYKGESTKKSSINYVFVFYNAMIIFARKHFTQSNARLFSFFINLAVYFRASLAIVSRFFKRGFWPLLDAAIIFAGFYYLQNYWQYQIFMVDSHIYPPEFIYIMVPGYIVFWLFSVYVNGGYDPPLKPFRIVRGIGLGTVAILVVYALLPSSLRFSRALILLGSVWALFSMLLSRTVYAFLKNKSLDPLEQNKRVLIAGDGKEAARIAQMLRQAGSTAFIGLVSIKQDKPPENNEGYIGNIKQVNEIIEVYKINEVIFCAGEMTSQAIIDRMSELKHHPVNFKIAPPESLYIIGSNSIDTFGDLFTININAVNKPANKRNKRLFDLTMAMGLLLTLPIHLFLVKKPGGFIKNLFGVIFNKKSWVGYHNNSSIQKLPALKKSVLHPADAFRNRNFELSTLKNLNHLYAKEFKIENDLRIFFKGYRNLGRR